jgi:hypothetical protein
MGWRHYSNEGSYEQECICNERRKNLQNSRIKGVAEFFFKHGFLFFQHCTREDAIRKTKGL